MEKTAQEPVLLSGASDNKYEKIPGRCPGLKLERPFGTL